MSDVPTWIATLSDGSTVAEKDMSFEPGQRKPWVQLTEKLGRDGQDLTSLRLNYKGRTIHMPRTTFDRFDYNGISRAPHFYSLCYHAEGTMDLSSGLLKQTDFIELCAHYGDFSVRFIQDVSEGANSWVVVTDDVQAMAETPRRRE